jgi:hypothetical protein
LNTQIAANIKTSTTATQTIPPQRHRFSVAPRFATFFRASASPLDSLVRVAAVEARNSALTIVSKSSGIRVIRAGVSRLSIAV